MRKTMPRSLLTALGKSLNPLMSDYVFYYGCSKLSCKNYGISPAASPIFSEMARRNEAIPSFTEFFREIQGRCQVSGHRNYLNNGFWPGGKKAKDVDGEALIAKTRQLWSGFLREYDVAVRLSEFDPICIISQDVQADIGQGMVDIYYQHGKDSKIFALAISHEGKASQKYYQDRKQAKSQPDVIRLIASNSGGLALHRVSDSQLLSLIKGQVNAA